MECKNCKSNLTGNERFCADCGIKVEIEKVLESVPFLEVPPTRLILLMILSFGFYSIYWFSKNFQAIQKIRKEKGKKTPGFFGALLSPLFSITFFKELQEIYKSKTDVTKSGFSPIIASIIFFLSSVLRYPFIGGIISMLWAQNLMKKMRSKGVSDHTVAKFNWNEIWVTLIGLIIAIIAISNQVTPDTTIAPIESTPITTMNVSDEQNRRAEIMFAGIEEELNADNPMQIDETSILEKVTPIGNILQYQYQTNFEELFSDARSTLIERLCSSVDMKPILDGNITLEYIYYSTSGNKIGDYFINNSDCN